MALSVEVLACLLSVLLLVWLDRLVLLRPRLLDLEDPPRDRLDEAEIGIAIQPIDYLLKGVQNSNQR